MLEIKKILCPLDYSEPSLEALKEACDWAQHFNAELLVVHVVPAIQPVLYEVPIAVVNLMAADEERRELDLKRLKDVVAESVPAGVPVTCEVLTGDPACEVVEAARRHEVDLLVLSTHGYTGWRHLVFGSIAEAIVRTATCPVLTHHMAGKLAGKDGVLTA
jgi:nucleotide-binding universal stress UspA family protein